MIVTLAFLQISGVGYYACFWVLVEAEVIEALFDFAAEFEVTLAVDVGFVGVGTELGVHLINKIDF